MNPVELYHFLQPKPFQPVRIHLKDGRSYDIRLRELVVVGIAWLKVGIPAPGESLPIYDHVVKIPLEEIDRLEHLSGAATSTAQ